MRYTVRVGGWSNPRTVIEEDGKVSLEVAMSHNHCTTCSERVRYVSRQLAQRNVQFSWAYPQGPRSFVVINAPGNGQAKELLSGLLDLHIR